MQRQYKTGDLIPFKVSQHNDLTFDIEKLWLLSFEWIKALYKLYLSQWVRRMEK